MVENISRPAVHYNMIQSRIEGQSAIIQALPEPTRSVTTEGLIYAASPSFRRTLGLSADALNDRQLGDIATNPPEQLSAFLHRCARSRQPALGSLTFAVSPNKAMAYRCEGVVVEPWTKTAPALVMLRLRLRESVVNRFALLSRTIEELNQEVRERRQVESHLRVLAEVSTTLAASLEYRTILQQVAELLAGRYADWCMVYLVEADRAIRRVATSHVHPTKMELARRLSLRSPEYAVPAPFIEVIERGQSLFCPEYDESTLLQGVTNAQQKAIIRRIDPKSVIAVPLQARGQALGALVLVRSESTLRYNEADLGFAEELARRTALVIENALLYQEARTAEAQLREFNHTLENLVAERTYELERSNEELNQFAYIASHDLKAPLRAINHLANWLVEDAGDVLPAVALDHVTKMRQRIARMERLLDDLLAYSRGLPISCAGNSKLCGAGTECGGIARAASKFFHHHRRFAS